MNKITLACPAKINLNLSVLRKKIDGMHEINSQFQLINLFDEMKIEKTSSKLINVSTNIDASINGKKILFIKLSVSYQIMLEGKYIAISVLKRIFLWEVVLVEEVQMLLEH